MGFVDRRNVSAGISGFALFSSSRGISASANYDAIVARGSAQRVAHVFGSLGEALQSAPVNPTKPFRILVTAGEWREPVIVSKPFIHLIGENRARSVIISSLGEVYNSNTSVSASADVSGQARTPGHTAPATLVVKAPYFRAENLTVANDFDYANNGHPGGQTRALMLTDGADRSVFERVRFTGYQDTLWADTGLSLFNRCEISGSVDFIYGAGCALFHGCNIISRLRPSGQTPYSPPGLLHYGYIAAPDTDVDQPYGLIFVSCRLHKESAVEPQTIALGRPWRRNPRAVGQAVYIHCWMDDHITREGWYHMQYYPKGGSVQFMEPEDARLFEYQSTGPGSGVASPRRRMLTPTEAREFASARVLGNWRPELQ
jgi:pectinesterase